MMETSNLSSNWKKLQATLAKTPKQETKNSTDDAASARSLKRKAENDLPPRAQAITKRSKQSTSSTYSAPSNKKPRRMGAYFSSQTTTQTPTSTVITVSTTPAPTNPKPSALAGKYIALDCEMVGTHSTTPFAVRQRTHATTSTATAPPEYSILARVSLVSYANEVLYDAYVLPPAGCTICDYRTPYSGITAWHLSPTNPTTRPQPFEEVQRAVAALLDGRILVGHALVNDLAVLGLQHPKRGVRDTARYPGFRVAGVATGRDGKVGKSRAPSLKKLAAEVLGWEIQGDERKGHSSVEDARAAMALFRREKDGFEREAAKLYGRPGQVKGGAGMQRASMRVEGGGEEGEMDEEAAERRRPNKKKQGRKK